ncbi:MAG: glycosyltransferase family 4 protein [Muribaculaceae bacterium]|nr:glycosyltransferase family 4 protein [Muribaculaceae bacterium]
MKVLLVHNDYGKYSGEEAVVDKMAVMLAEMGHGVAQLRRSTAGARESLAGKIHGFLAGIYCPGGVRAMRDALRRERPDVVNVHNLYPFISPAALRECKKAGVPVVMTIHNFRLMCPTGLFMRDNAPCELCLQRGNEWGCVRHNCEHSLLKSAGYAARSAVARVRRHYADCVDRFACITDFQRRKLIEAGFPAEKLLVVPNSVDAGTDVELTPGGYVAYSGRISREKGVDLIIEVARRHPDIPFRLAGAVRDTELVAQLPPNVELTGYLSGEALSAFYAGARFFVMASRWYEGFPMTILEAARWAKPMIAPDHGGFTEIIGTGDSAIGRLVAPADTNALESAVRHLWDSPDESMRLGAAARSSLIARYSTSAVSALWSDLLKQLTQ